MAHGSVSVVIPTRDRGTLLHAAVASVFAAPTPPDEVIIADDDSVDGSVGEVIRAFPSVLLVRGTFGNPARARNAGVAASTGDLLAFLDSDDLMSPPKTSSLADRLRADDGLVLVHGTTDAIDADGTPAPALTKIHRDRYALGARTGLDYAGLAEVCAMFTSATVIRRSSFEEIGGYDESLDAYEDWDLYLRLSLVGRLAYDASPAAKYRVWPGNMPWDRTARWTIRVAEKHLAALPPLDRTARKRASYGLLRRLAESHNVLGDRRATRKAAIAAARAEPTRAAIDPAIWRPFLRSVIRR
ncbi:MAG TPA: glycosyltransferase family A protein [Gaiellaceae bacterium]|jgi:glycosyltransferase involved in cell wall biosynthesis|nr:glycosyltransferase family A protein [Gaiellaceae bacterium]